jgi:hypothetical protein
MIDGPKPTFVHPLAKTHPSLNLGSKELLNPLQHQSNSRSTILILAIGFFDEHLKCHFPSKAYGKGGKCLIFGLFESNLLQVVESVTYNRLNFLQ